MIDPVSAFGMLTTAHAGIKKIISMGQDFSKASNYVMKYAKAEAELSFGKERKKKGLFGGIMDQAIEQHFKEEEQKRMKDELRRHVLHTIVSKSISIWKCAKQMTAKIVVKLQA